MSRAIVVEDSRGPGNAAKASLSARFVKGHGFGLAAKRVILDSPNGLQSARVIGRTEVHGEQQNPTSGAKAQVQFSMHDGTAEAVPLQDRIGFTQKPAGLARVLLAATLVLVALAVGALAEEATPLSLAEAVRMTLANNPMHKAAMADTKAASAGVREARAPLLPRITFAENFTAGNDPVFVFGTETAAAGVYGSGLRAELAEPANADRQLRQPLLRAVEFVRQHAELEGAGPREVSKFRI